MTLVGLATRNLTRNKLRTGLAVAIISVAVLLFLVLRTIIWAWNLGAEVAAKDRVVTRHKVTFVLPLPRRYARDSRSRSTASST
jgi:putative ABC transport system permease protein